MPLRVYDATAEAGCDAMVDTVDDGAGPGKVQIFTGAQPALNAALSGTLLAEFDLSDPGYGNASASGSGAVALAASLPKTDPDAAAAGTAGYGAVLDSDDVVKWTGTVSAPGGGGDFQIDNIQIALGQQVQLTALSFNLGQQGT